MSWKIAKRERPEAENEPPRTYVSVNKRGEIALSAEAWAAIREPWSVNLLWDEKRRRLGVKFPVRDEGEFFSVRPYGRGGRMRIVSAVRMLKQFGVSVTDTLVFRSVGLEMHKKEPMLVLPLDEAERIEK